MNDIILSIYVPTYNHEKYIAQALDSILMQKTEYSYEVLVGEDCSTDNTKKILEEYERKYPNVFKMFYREKNMYGEKISNASDLKLRCKGKYVICLEGDDYWTDEHKIEKQITFLEQHPEYMAVSHKCLVVDEYSNPNGEKYPECNDEKYTLKHFISEIMPGQLTTFMHRNCFKNEFFESDIFFQGLIPGDKILYYTIATYGKIYCMQDVMSAYRHVKNNGTSYSATYRYDFNEHHKWSYGLMNYVKKSKNKDALKYSKLHYFKNLMLGLKSKQCSKKKFIELCKNIDKPIGTIFLYGKYWIRHNLLHKEIWV